MPNDLSARLRSATMDHPEYGLCIRMSLKPADVLAAADLIDQQAAEIERLRGVLRPLVEACEADCTGPETADEPDAAAVGAAIDGDMALTFGMIRAGRKALGEAP